MERPSNVILVLKPEDSRRHPEAPTAPATGGGGHPKIGSGVTSTGLGFFFRVSSKVAGGGSVGIGGSGAGGTGGASGATAGGKGSACNRRSDGLTDTALGCTE